MAQKKEDMTWLSLRRAPGTHACFLICSRRALERLIVAHRATAVANRVKA
jgi:hypothetical protein